MISDQHQEQHLASLVHGSHDGEGAADHDQPCRFGSRPRTCTLLTRDAHGQPRTYRVAPAITREAAYRRLAVAILRLDVATLAHDLESARHGAAHTDSRNHRHEVRAAA